MLKLQNRGRKLVVFVHIYLKSKLYLPQSPIFYSHFLLWSPFCLLTSFLRSRSFFLTKLIQTLKPQKQNLDIILKTDLIFLKKFFMRNKDKFLFGMRPGNTNQNRRNVQIHQSSVFSAMSEKWLLLFLWFPLLLNIACCSFSILHPSCHKKWNDVLGIC